MEIDLCAIKEDPSPLFGLLGDATMTFSSISLLVRAGIVAKIVEFLVVDRPTSYNAIVGTQWLNSMRVIPSTFHLCLKFLTPHGIKTIQGDRRISQACFAAELKRKNSMTQTSNKKRPTLDEKAPNQDSSEIFWQS
ncbi:hypothetical protein Bca4012_020101 [Brassica carinata]